MSWYKPLIKKLSKPVALHLTARAINIHHKAKGMNPDVVTRIADDFSDAFLAGGIASKDHLSQAAPLSKRLTLDAGIPVGDANRIADSVIYKLRQATDALGKDVTRVPHPTETGLRMLAQSPGQKSGPTWAWIKKTEPLVSRLVQKEGRLAPQGGKYSFSRMRQTLPKIESKFQGEFGHWSGPQQFGREMTEYGEGQIEGVFKVKPKVDPQSGAVADTQLAALINTAAEHTPGGSSHPGGVGWFRYVDRPNSKTRIVHEVQSDLEEYLLKNKHFPASRVTIDEPKLQRLVETHLKGKVPDEAVSRAVDDISNVYRYVAEGETPPGAMDLVVAIRRDHLIQHMDREASIKTAKALALELSERNFLTHEKVKDPQINELINKVKDWSISGLAALTRDARKKGLKKIFIPEKHEMPMGFSESKSKWKNYYKRPMRELGFKPDKLVTPGKKSNVEDIRLRAKRPRIEAHPDGDLAARREDLEVSVRTANMLSRMRQGHPYTWRGQQDNGKFILNDIKSNKTYWVNWIKDSHNIHLDSAHTRLRRIIRELESLRGETPRRRASAIFEGNYQGRGSTVEFELTQAQEYWFDKAQEIINNITNLGEAFRLVRFKHILEQLQRHHISRGWQDIEPGSARALNQLTANISNKITEIKGGREGTPEKIIRGWSRATTLTIPPAIAYMSTGGQD